MQPSKSNSKPKPEALAMIICDTVMDDRKTNKKILVGTFNNIGAVNFPVRHLEMHVFIVLTGGHGKYQGVLRCIQASSEKPIMELSGPIEFHNPLHVIEIDFALKQLVFPKEGTYIFQLCCDSEIIMQRKFMVTKQGA